MSILTQTERMERKLKIPLYNDSISFSILHVLNLYSEFSSRPFPNPPFENNLLWTFVFWDFEFHLFFFFYRMKTVNKGEDSKLVWINCWERSECYDCSKKKGEGFVALFMAAISFRFAFFGDFFYSAIQAYVRLSFGLRQEIKW